MGLTGDQWRCAPFLRCRSGRGRGAGGRGGVARGCGACAVPIRSQTAARSGATSALPRRLPQLTASVTVAVSTSQGYSSLTSFWFWGFDFVTMPMAGSEFSNTRWRVVHRRMAQS